jgi:hypothetical protein
MDTEGLGCLRTSCPSGEGPLYICILCVCVCGKEKVIRRERETLYKR